MAGEFRHEDVGPVLAETEYDGITAHQFDSQATGDTMYASSATQLSRLAKGAVNTVLVMGASIPKWSATLAGLTLTSPTINGTIETTGLGINGALNIGTVIQAGAALAAVVAYNRIGATATSHSLASDDDLMVSGKLEVNGVVSFDSTFDLYGLMYTSSDITLTDTHVIRNYAVTAGQSIHMAARDVDGTAWRNMLTLTNNNDPSIGIGGFITCYYSGYASLTGYTKTTSYHELTEMAAPGAGAADTVRIYALEGGGDALTDLCAVFQDGTVDVFAQESTEPDSPIFQFPDDTKLSLTMRKPDRKTIQFVATYPDGREYVMREIRYPVARW